MTIAMLTAIIASFCGMKDSHITKTEKMECIDFMSNCAVIEDGITTSEQVNKCEENWADISYRYHREH